MRKFLKWTAIILAGYLIIVHPTKAATMVKDGGSAAAGAADSATSFVTDVVPKR